MRLIFCDFFFSVSAEPNAAGGRCSEAQHGQSNEKASGSTAFDYALPIAEKKSPKKKSVGKPMG